METYLPILHLPRVELRCKLQEKLLEDQEQTGALNPAWLPPSSAYASRLLSKELVSLKVILTYLGGFFLCVEYFSVSSVHRKLNLLV